MSLVKPHDLFSTAVQEHWALGAFNTANLEITQAIIRGLAAMKSPGIVQTSESSITYAGLETLRDIIQNVAEVEGVPVVLHLDHGKTFEIAKRCIEAGYQSVMIDGSSLPLSENIALTREVVTFAHERGVWVEGEVGAIQGKEGMREGDVSVNESLLTDPVEAEQFVQETGVDALAVSVGTLHGAFRGEEKLRSERLKEIRSRLPEFPLVLHGASGLPNEEVATAVKLGVVKVNIDTELREAFHGEILKHEEGDGQHSVDPRKMISPAREAVQVVVEQKVRVLGSEGKAK